MTLTADFTTGHGAVLRANRQAKQAAAPGEREILPRTETRIFPIFPERTARMETQSREAARRKACLIAMCAPTSVFLTLAAWYLAL